MTAPKRWLIPIAAGFALAGVSVTAASADVLTFNPQVTNAPAGGVIDPAQTAFQADSAVFGGQSLAQITNTGATTSFEKGNIFITSFNLGINSVTSSVNSATGYAIIGTYFISDSGTYTAATAGGPGTYTASAGPASVSISLYAVPSTNVTFNGGLPTSSSPTPI